MTDKRFQSRVRSERQRLNNHLRETIAYHFAPETGTPFWIRWRENAGWDPVNEIQTIDDIIRFPQFEDDWLRYTPLRQWIPKAYAGRPYKIFETGGTTGMPKQRLGWDDHETDYEEFSAKLDDSEFPPGGDWLMLGPTGPHRLRVAIEYLANYRGGSCYHVDMDVRWVKKLVANRERDLVERYIDHILAQGLILIRQREIKCLFTTPKLLERLGEKISIPDSGISGVFCGGTSMSPQTLRFLIEEVLANQTKLAPTYGNTLMGLACSIPLNDEMGYSVTYHAPQPRAYLRVVNPDNPKHTVEYDEWGRIELTTMTREFFMPRLLERDEAIRRRPCDHFPWDGVGEVRPLRVAGSDVSEGVY